MKDLKTTLEELLSEAKGNIMCESDIINNAQVALKIWEKLQFKYMRMLEELDKE